MARIISHCSPAMNKAGLLAVEVTHVIGDSRYASVPSLATVDRAFTCIKPKRISSAASGELFYSLGDNNQSCPGWPLSAAKECLRNGTGVSRASMYS
jgi:hypothetical protein